MEHDVAQIVDRFWRSLEQGDYATVRTLLAPDATLWWCCEQNHRSLHDQLAAYEARDRALDPEVQKDRKRYRLVREWIVGTDCLQQIVAEIETPKGKVEVPQFLRLSVVDGKIEALEEYFDSVTASGVAAGEGRAADTLTAAGLWPRRS
jgi:ketosteroid isomerase-like protein